jgi:hypothetical protein
MTTTPVLFYGINAAPSFNGPLTISETMYWGYYITLYIGVVVTFWFVLGLAFFGIRICSWGLVYLTTNRKTVLSATWKWLYTALLFYLYLILLTFCY